MEWKIGQKVQREGKTYRVTGIREIKHLWVMGERGVQEHAPAYEYEPVLPLAAEDAWLEVALLLGRMTETYACIGSEWTQREMRHKAYQILGGNGVKVTEEVKARVRGLIERAVKQHE